MLPSQVEILPPQPRPVRRIPWVALVGFAGAVALSLWLRPAMSREQFLADIAAKAFTVAAACALAAWIEHRIFAANSGYSGFRQLAVATLLPLLSAALGAALVYVVLRAGPRLRDDGTLLLAASASGLWLTHAALGAWIVAVVEIVLRRLAPGYRSRVTLAVFALFIVEAGIVFGFVRSARRLADAFPATTAAVRAYFRSLTDSSDGIVNTWSHLTGTQKGLAGMLAFGLLALLPAVLSACAKLADGVTERLEPLVPAFEAVGEGRLEVLLEEGGSREFARASRAYNQMVEKLEETRRLERSFSPYVSPAVLQRIGAQSSGQLPAAAMRDATVLHVEIRGLLSFSQVMAPARLFQFLNLYFDRIAGVVARYEGYLDKFIGDAVIITFNAPVDQPDHRERATRCAIDLQKETTAMNRAGAFADIGQVSIAVGIATGWVIAGGVGAGGNGQYVALGDTVSLASKLAGLTPPGQVWVNQATADGLPADLPTLLLAAASVRGKAVPIVPYRVWPPP